MLSDCFVIVVNVRRLGGGAVALCYGGVYASIWHSGLGLMPGSCGISFWQTPGLAQPRVLTFSFKLDSRCVVSGTEHP